MSKEKQIEEMAEAIFQNCNCGLFFSEAEKIARFVIEEQGCRKQRDVAREIFDEIERTFKGLLNGDISNILKLLSTLKKEYVEQKLDESEKALEDRRKEDEENENHTKLERKEVEMPFLRRNKKRKIYGLS